MYIMKRAEPNESTGGARGLIGNENTWKPWCLVLKKITCVSTNTAQFFHEMSLISLS